MASAVTDEDLDFHAAFVDYQVARSDEERSAAGRLLRAELERRMLSLEAAHKRETHSRELEFMKELARLEEQLRLDLKEKDQVTAVRKACVEICMKKIDSDPEEAALYANLILSWAANQNQTSTPTWCVGGELWDHMQEVKKGYSHYREPAARVAIRVAKMKPEQIKRISADLEVFLKNRGYSIPGQELYAGLSGSVRIEKTREANIKYWKEVVGAFTASVGVVASVVSTLQAIKHVTPDDIEPLLTCRHHLPPGWFF